MTMASVVMKVKSGSAADLARPSGTVMRLLALKKKYMFFFFKAIKNIE